jgi:hypothetical protein
MGKDNIIYLNAENPQNLTISMADGQVQQEVEGTASRPMRLSFFWEHLSPCLFDGAALTKFKLNGSNSAVISHEMKLSGGRNLDVTKLFMPTQDESESHVDDDEFRIPKNESKVEASSENPAGKPNDSNDSENDPF